MTDTPAVLNVTVNGADRDPQGRSINIIITITWMQPQNLDQFDIDRYVISVTSTSGIQHMATACGECTSTTVTVTEDPGNVELNTNLTVTIAATSFCNETGPTGSDSYIFSK